MSSVGSNSNEIVEMERMEITEQILVDGRNSDGGSNNDVIVEVESVVVRLHSNTSLMWMVSKYLSKVSNSHKFRILQLLFSTLAVILMAVNYDFTQVPAFCYFLAANGVLAIWSFCRAAAEGFAKAKNISMNSGWLFLLFAIGDEIISFVAFTSACGSVAILGVLFFDFQDTSTPNYSKFASATLMGFIAVLLMLPTVHSNFCSNMQHAYPVTIKRLGEFGRLSGLILHLLKLSISSASLCIGGHGFEGHTVYWAFVSLVGTYVVWSFILVLCDLYTYSGGGCDLRKPETIGRWVLYEWFFGNALIGAAFASGSVLNLYSSYICSRLNPSFCHSNKKAVIFAILAYSLSIISRVIMIGQRARIKRECVTERARILNLTKYGLEVNLRQIEGL